MPVLDRAEYYATPIPPRDPEDTGQRPDLSPWQVGTVREQVADHQPMLRVGKKAAGRLLDGREWDEFPEAS